jgi:hypothetical protein
MPGEFLHYFSMKMHHEYSTYSAFGAAGTGVSLQYNICALSTVMVRVSDIILHKGTPWLNVFSFQWRSVFVQFFVNFSSLSLTGHAR